MNSDDKKNGLMCKLNILLATYNGEEYLEEQILSVLQQSYTDWSLLIHDDGSTDRTVPIIKKYQKRYPNRIRFLDDKIRFGSASKNFSFLLQHADADYIMFCDQDDIWMPKKIEKTVAAFKQLEERFPALPILLHTDLSVVDNTLNTIDPSFWHYQRLYPKYNTLNRLLMQNTVTGCTMMINAKLAKLASPVPDQAIMHDWWIALVAGAFGKIGYVDEPTIFYRQHASNDTGAKKMGLLQITCKLFQKYSLNTNIAQAKALLEQYDEELPKEKRDVVHRFISLETQGFFPKRLSLIKYAFFKHGLLRNIGLFIKI